MRKLFLFVALCAQITFLAPSVIASEWKGKGSWSRASEAGAIALEKGQFLRAEQTFKEALKLARNSGNKEFIANSLCNLAAAEDALGKNGEAISISWEAVAILERESHLRPDLYIALNNLAAIYLSSGRVSDAVAAYKRIVTVMAKDSEAKPSDRTRYLDLLAELCAKEGRLEEALPLCVQSLVIKEKAHFAGGELANAVSRLANLYYCLGRLREAEVYNNRALAIEQKLADTIGVTAVYNNLGLIYTEQGRYGEAESAFKRVLAVLEKRAGTDEKLSQTLGNLANVYMEKEQPQRAEPLYLRALQIKEKLVGASAEELDGELSNLANCYRQQGKLAKAGLLFDRALKIVSKSGVNDFQKAPFLNNLALFYVTQGKYSQAELLYKRAIAALEKGLGTNHPEVNRIRRNYADLLDHVNRHDESRALRIKAGKIKLRA